MRVVVIDCDHGTTAIEECVARAAGAEFEAYQCANAAEAAKVAAGAEIVISQRIPIDGRLLEALPAVRVIGRYGSGMDSVDGAAVRRRGITVVYTPDFCYPDVADHALALILDLVRQVTRLSTAMKGDPRAFAAGYANRLELLSNTRRLSDITLGIVGFGKIGREVAKRARSFGMNILAHDPYARAEAFAAEGAARMDLDGLLKSADIVTLHAPLTGETRGMLDATRLASMKPGSLLVNVARAQLVDESALVQALRSGHLAGAALDVTNVEPIPLDHPFLGMSNVLLTPHTAFYSARSFQTVKEDVVRFAIHALIGEGERVVFDPEAPLRPIYLRS